jgi:hypothetical protein
MMATGLKTYFKKIFVPAKAGTHAAAPPSETVERFLGVSVGPRFRGDDRIQRALAR